MPNIKRRREIREEMKSNSGFKPNDVEESYQEFPLVKIQRKSINEERRWMKEKIQDIKWRERIRDGESFEGTTIEAISKSIPLSNNTAVSCAIKLSNFLNFDLENPQYHISRGQRICGPHSGVAAHRQEAFSFLGDWYGCNFLCSLEINQTLRLTIRCGVYFNGDFTFGIAFTPAHDPTDQILYSKLHAFPAVPDVWMKQNSTTRTPIELFVSHENFLVGGHMTSGPRSIVHVEILEKTEDLSTNARITVKSEQPNMTIQNSGIVSRVPAKSRRFSCEVEIVNCLNVTLQNWGKFYCKSEKQDFMPTEVLPFQRKTFFGADDGIVKAIFSYEIDSTDIEIIVGLKVGPNLKSFAAEFTQRPAVNKTLKKLMDPNQWKYADAWEFLQLFLGGAEQLENLMDPSQWRTHDYKKYADAKEGKQFIQMGNIRAEMRMTEEEHSLFKIRVFAV